MKVEDLVDNFPTLYHMAEADTWGQIRKYGLRSTTALLDLFEISGSERYQIQSAHRAESVTITHPRYGTAVIRDQKPMSDSGLLKCLDGMSPTEWYETLNKRVFFWLTKDRLLSLLGARAYRARKHCVLTVSTEMMVKRHAPEITLSPINSGCTKPNPQPRGVWTFSSIADYPFEEWRKKRRVQDSVVELAVEYCVPNVQGLVTRVEHMLGADVLDVVWKQKID